MKLKPFLRIVLCILIMAVAVVIIANVVDYQRCSSAVTRMQRIVTQIKSLSQQDLAALGDYARTFSTDDFLVFHKEKIPHELASLQPETVIVEADHGAISMRLDSTNESALFFTIYTSPTNQCIRLNAFQDGRDSPAILWHRDPVLAKSLSPGQRLATIRFNYREWIVLPDEIRVIQRGDESGCNDEILATESLSLAAQKSLKMAIDAIPESVRGKHISPTHVRNAQYLSVNFTRNGPEGEDDINICNAWVEPLAPLLDGVSRFGPKDYPITYKQVISTLNISSQGPVVVLTNQDFWNKQHSRLTGPWWCLWRYLLKTNPII